jgi:L-aspartate oxidase
MAGFGAVWRRETDVVVVGSGAAGISVALTAAARGLRVLLVTKDLAGGATPLAQGGLAAALGAGDTPAAHVSDTLTAGVGLCEPDVVAALAAGAPGAIGWLAGLGAQLETKELRLEGGHSANRIVHSGDDATGAEVHRALLAALLGSEVEILDRTVALRLLPGGVTGSPSGPRGMDAAGTGAGARVADGTAAANAGPAGALAGELVPALPGCDEAGGPTAGGALLNEPLPDGVLARRAHAGGTVTRPADEAGGEPGVAGLLAGAIGADGRLTPGVIAARAVVIAAGGLGQAFGTTSNPAGATGDGIAIAARAGAVIRDLEFVQFHPTVLWLPGASGQCPLITEALRGAGAVLRDLDGTPLMAGHDPRGDLAPRDVVAARMAEVIAAGDAGHVWLDASALGADMLENGFPTVTAACRKHGIDPVTAMIPAAPGAHYSCGGILADLDGRTTLPGLYAVGEAASTGVQGANRLASNSVTEAIIAGRRTGEAIAAAVAPDGCDTHPAIGGSLPQPSVSMAAGAAAYLASVRAVPDVAEGRRELAAAMSRWAGVMRDADGLGTLLKEIAGGDLEAAATVLDPDDLDLELESVEAASLRAVSLLIAAGALRRAESRGCHRRRDAAERAAAPWHTLLRWDGRELLVTEEEM